MGRAAPLRAVLPVVLAVAALTSACSNDTTQAAAAPVASPRSSASPTAAPDRVAPSPRAPVRVTPVTDLRPFAEPGADVRTLLGPPPGPQPDRRPDRVAARQDRYALLVGVTDYRAPTHDTIGASNDVRVIARRLELSGWPAANIRVLTDEQATGAAIREGLTWLAAESRPGTFAMFHWSGHVKQLGGGREALWPVDRDFVEDRELTAALAPAQGRLWVDVAGCEAGSFQAGLPSDRVLFTGSSTASEKSYEYPRWTMSVWSGLLFDQGIRLGLADADADRRVTIGEATRYASYWSQAVTHGQQPYGPQTPVVAGASDLGWTLADPPA